MYIPWVGLALATIYFWGLEYNLLGSSVLSGFPEALSQIPIIYSLFLVPQEVQNPRRTHTSFTSHFTGQITVCVHCPEAGADV